MKYSDEDYRYVLCYSGVPSCWRVQPEDMPVDRPIPMILFCPTCGTQHIDAPDHPYFGGSVDANGCVPRWDNPPHRSHLCHGCGCIWRPADVPTTGVEKIETRGQNDTFDPAKPHELPRARSMKDVWHSYAVELGYRGVPEAMHDLALRIGATLPNGESSEEVSRDYKRLAWLEKRIAIGERIEFAPGLLGNGVAIGLRPYAMAECRGKDLRACIDQAMAEDAKP